MEWSVEAQMPLFWVNAGAPEQFVDQNSIGPKRFRRGLILAALGTRDGSTRWSRSSFPSPTEDPMTLEEHAREPKLLRIAFD